MSQADAEFPDADPLIDEVRAIRKALSDQFDNDVGRLCDHLRRFEAQYEERLERPPAEEAARRPKAES